jgi:hypothetical protein
MEINYWMIVLRVIEMKLHNSVIKNIKLNK